MQDPLLTSAGRKGFKGRLFDIDLEVLVSLISRIIVTVLCPSVRHLIFIAFFYPGPHSAVGKVSDCRSRGREFDPGPVPYFRGD